MKLTAHQLLYAVRVSREKAMIAQAGLRAIQFQEMPPAAVSILRAYNARKSAQCYRFEGRLLGELARLREQFAALAWQARPSRAGKYVHMPLPHLQYIVSFVDVWDYGDMMLANGEGDTARPVEELGGLWLKLPDVPENKAA